MTMVINGKNPTQAYERALHELLTSEDVNVCSPRGKEIRELRPVIFEFDPKHRVTFAKGRVINPFFQLAEALWIMAGRSDVEWLTDYNKSIAQFSDDGKFFNAPYGERLRYWNKNSASGTIINPIDQLEDVYKKFKHDIDTRQAVAVISNPMFDNSEYTTGGGKDVACNLILTFKQRNGKLDLSVFNRSNDLHWGTFGANLCQFSTLLSMMASWLNLETGTYYQITDSLHIYMDSYGAKETDKMCNAYEGGYENLHFDPHSARMLEELSNINTEFQSDYESFHKQMYSYFSLLDRFVRQSESYESDEAFGLLKGYIAGIPDNYIRLTVTAMASYQAHKKDKKEYTLKMLDDMPRGEWHVSCMRFLSPKYKEMELFQSMLSEYTEYVQSYILREDIR